jgi:hypothetical protein
MGGPSHARTRVAAASPIGTETTRGDASGACFPRGLPGEWAVMIVDHGGHYATADEVADWPDITSKT